MSDGYAQAKGQLIGWLGGCAAVAGVALTGDYPLWLRAIIGLIAGLLGLVLCFSVDLWCNWDEFQRREAQREKLRRSIKEWEARI